MSVLLGIDEGTSAVKVVAVDRDLRIVAQARREKVTRHPRPGWVEQDGEAILDAVVAAVGEVLDALGGREVAATGLDHQGESVLAWDPETGTPRTPVVVWQDDRHAADLARMPGSVVEKTGLPLDPYFSAGKLGWLARHADLDGARLGTVDAFLSDRLGAGHATDPSTASRTQLAVPGEGWDAELCLAFGVDRRALPEICDTVGELGELRHPSWPVALRLTARLVDQQAALAGSGCVLPGRAKATYGTGVFVLANTGSRRPDPGSGLLPTVAWRIAGETTYAVDGGVFTAGALLDWLAGGLGLAEDGAALAMLAAEVPDAAGVEVLPALAGLGAPWWDASARGVIAGLHGGVRPGHVGRAALEGIAWRVADIVERLDPRPEVLRVDGGLTRSPLLLALQADALGLPVEPGPPDATALGAAALAGVGAGWWTVEELAGRIGPAGPRVLPDGDGPARALRHASWRVFLATAGALAHRA